MKIMREFGHHDNEAESSLNAACRTQTAQFHQLIINIKQLAA
jgi:hypothetical protein